MAVDPVPWMVGGGAQHSPETGRNMLHIATSRAHGITGTSDLFVQPYTVPGAGVRVGTGSALILRDGTPSSQETYSFRAPTATNLSVAPTGSGGGRTDLVVARIEDPNNLGSPWQTPSDRVNGPYSFLRVIPGVPAGTTEMAQAGRGGDTAEVLARIDIPANTGTITAGMITDLRRMAQPRQNVVTNFNQNSTAPASLTSETWTLFPNYAPGNIVPEWATHVQARAWVSGLYTAGPADGGMRLELWGPNYSVIAVGPEQLYDVDVPIAQWGTQPANTTGGGAIRFPMTFALYAPIHQFRNQMAYIRLGGYKKPNRPDRAAIQNDWSTSIVFDLTFYEKAI